MDVLMVVIVLALLATGASLFLGLLAMSSGGENDRKFSTPFMWTRLIFHGVTLLLLVTAVIIR